MPLKEKRCLLAAPIHQAVGFQEAFMHMERYLKYIHTTRLERAAGLKIWERWRGVLFHGVLTLLWGSGSNQSAN